MSDQCRNCSIRGLSILKCSDTTSCSIPESWYAGELRSALAEKDAELAAVRLNHQGSEAVIFAVIDAIGGEVEGLPTQRINFLQRVRELVRKEKELAEAKREVERLKEQYRSLECWLLRGGIYWHLSFYDF